MKDILAKAASTLAGPSKQDDLDIEQLRQKLNEDPVADLFADWSEREEWMRPRTRKWKESLGFDRGDHWGTWNDATRTWASQSLPVSGMLKEKPYVNHYASIIRTIVAHMTKNRPVAEVLPETSSSEDVESAQACNHLLDHVWQDISIQTLLAGLIRWLLHANIVYVRPRWDPNAGDLVPLEMPAELEGQPQQYIRSGKVVVDTLSPLQVFPQKEAKDWKSCGDVIIEHLLTPAQVLAIWPDMQTTPEPDTTGDDGTVFLAVSETEQGYTSGKLEYIRVLERFVLPNPQVPEGRHVCATKDYILTDEPYGEPEFPILCIRGEPYPLSFHGRSWMWDLLGPQRSFNSSYAQIQTHVDLACNPPWLVPKGSVDNKDLTKRAGAIIPYDHLKGPPTMATFAAVPAWVLDMPERAQKAMSDLSVSEILQGRVPFSGLSGRTVAFISDLDATRLGTLAKSLAEFLGLLGEACLHLIQQNGPDTITFRLLNDSVAELYAFQKASLRFGSVRVTESTLLPIPDSVRRENLNQQFQAKTITLEEYKEALRGTGNLQDTDMQAADRAWARDNLVTIQQGGQPFTGRYMDYPVHLYETRKFMKSAQFRRLHPMMIARIEEYEQKLDLTYQKMQQSMAPATPQAEGAPGAPAPAQPQQGGDDEDDLVGGQGNAMKAAPQNPGVDAAAEQAMGMGNLP